MKKSINIIAIVSIIGLVALAAACGSGTTTTSEKVIKSGPIGNNLTVTLSSESGRLKNGAQDIMIAFTDASGKAVDVGSASLNFHMPAMGSMAAMHESATLTTTSTPGVYNGKVKISMAGDWQAQIAIEGAAGSGKANLLVTAQ